MKTAEEEEEEEEVQVCGGLWSLGLALAADLLRQIFAFQTAFLQPCSTGLRASELLALQPDPHRVSRG